MFTFSFSRGVRNAKHRMGWSFEIKMSKRISFISLEATARRTIQIIEHIFQSRRTPSTLRYMHSCQLLAWLGFMLTVDTPASRSVTPGSFRLMLSVPTRSWKDFIAPPLWWIRLGMRWTGPNSWVRSSSFFFILLLSQPFCHCFDAVYYPTQQLDHASRRDAAPCYRDMSFSCRFFVHFRGLCSFHNTLTISLHLISAPWLSAFKPWFPGSSPPITMTWLQTHLPNLSKVLYAMCASLRLQVHAPPLLY